MRWNNKPSWDIWRLSCHELPRLNSLIYNYIQQFHNGTPAFNDLVILWLVYIVRGDSVQYLHNFVMMLHMIFIIVYITVVTFTRVADISIWKGKLRKVLREDRYNFQWNKGQKLCFKEYKTRFQALIINYIPWS